MDFWFRFLTILLFVIWQLYWKITERKADKEKPKKLSMSTSAHVQRYALHFLVYFVVFLQVCGVPLLPFSADTQVVGFLIMLLGMAISFSARISLGTNWAHAVEYQIKKNHELVTGGIYQYIRHPIYTGILLSLTGAELVAKSYLYLVIFFVGFFVNYRQAKLEEKILEKHFGKEYRDYKKRTKMLIPFVW